MTGVLLQTSGPVVDLQYRVRALPTSGGEAIVDDFALTAGGGLNAMVAARRAGLRVVCGGGVGTGPFGQIVQAALRDEGITLARAPDARHDSGCCTVLVEPSGERSFVAAAGAEGLLGTRDLDDLDLTGIGWVLVSGYTLHYPGSRQALADWLTRLPRNLRVVFDPTPVVAELRPDILVVAMGRADWISANAAEATILTGQDDPDTAARLLAKGRQGAVVRDGARGCVLATDGVAVTVAPFAVDPVDTNGAGDTHIGSFIARMAAGDQPLRAAQYANVAAALSTLTRGPATAPPRPDVEARMATATPSKKAG